MGIKAKNSGFTIIEVSLFLVISSFLLVGLMTGITVSVQQQRFSDSLNSTRSFLQQQFNETQYVLNNREITNCTNGSLGGSDPNTSPGGSSCMVVGKLIDLGPPQTGSQETEIVVSDIIADVTLPLNYKDRGAFPSFRDLIGSSQLSTKVVNNQNRQNFIIPWDGQFTRIVEGDNPTIAPTVRYLSLIKSPVTGTINVYKIDITGEIVGDSYSLVDVGSTQIIQDYIPIHICMTSQDALAQRGVISINSIGSQDSITIEVDGPEGYQKWC